MTDKRSERYTRNLQRITSRFARIEQFIDTIKDDIDHSVIIAHRDWLNEAWCDYKELVADHQNTEEQEHMCDAIEFRYPTLRASLIREESRHKDVPTTKQTLPQQLNQIKLPKININPFIGDDITLWPQFKDIYETAVYNVEYIPAIQKYQILIGLLKGDALAEISDIKITDANYWVAYDKLLAKFDKPKRITAAHLNAFFNIASVKETNSKALNKLCSQSESILRQLAMLHTNATSRDVWIIHMLLMKVDPQTRDEWARQSISWQYPTEEQFFKFLKERCDALDNSICITAKTKTRASEGMRSTITHHTSVNACIVCNGDHNLFKCHQFKKMEIDERRKFVREKGLCFNCLSRGHSGSNCRSKFRCHLCDSRHHTLLHNLNTSNETSVAASQPSFTNSQRTTTQSHFIQTNTQSQPLVSQLDHETQFSQVTDATQSYSSNLPQDTPTINQSVNFALLPTILVHVRDNYGILQTCRALLDTGSQSSFITENCFQRLGLPRTNARIPVTGLAEKGAGYTRGKSHLVLFSRLTSESFISVDVLILNKLTQMLPSQSINANLHEFNQLELADPTYHTPGKIDILLGADVVFHILKPSQVFKEQCGLIAQNTIFGWVICGGIDANLQSTTVLTTQLSLQNLDSTLRRFWEIENFTSSKSLWSTEEKMCEEHFLATHRRDSTGRFIVELPFRSIERLLGDSLFLAIKRQCAIEKRLASNNERII